MIVVDTSALLATALGEPSGRACSLVLLDADVAMVSAGTMVEALIVAQGRAVAAQVFRLLEQPNVTVVGVTEASARRAAQAYAQWGKGNHPAGLNFGDCFAYELAIHQDCPLLFIGGDFSKTDVKSAL